MKNLIVEIGTEEIPASALGIATDYLESESKKLLKDARIKFNTVRILSTPRRIIIKIDGVAEETTAVEQEFRGPSVKRAFDEDGNPTKAAEGFAKSKGVDVSQLERRDEGGAEYLYATISKPSQDSAELLGSIVEQLISTIPWKRSQRWGSHAEHFSRPVRWLLGLFGGDVLDFEYAGLKSDRITYGHRVMAPDAIEVEDANALLPALENAYVICDPVERASKIRAQISAAEKETGLEAKVPRGTFEEVIGLVEYPTVLVGHFDEEFLEVPPEIITDAMLSHQRYFPMYEKDGKLSNAFIVVSNGDPACNQTIIEGNERVVRARLADASFFYHEDLKRPLESYVDDLDKQVFQEQLGSMKEKVNRMVDLAGELAEEAGVDEETTERAKRAAKLSKADLVTNTVVEFTSQQGVMGGYYARASDEPEEVATAVEQHYRPRFAGDELPENTEGKIDAVADKLDTIAGLFATGQPPTGSKDPYALRRNAIGILAILQSGLEIDLDKAIDQALDNYTEIEFDHDEVKQQIVDFFKARLENIAKERGYDSDVINAVLDTGTLNPVEVLSRCEALTKARDEDPGLYDDLETAYKRANNLRDAALGTDIDESIMTEQEKTLLAAVRQAREEVEAALDEGDYKKALEALAGLREPIDDFFAGVMVMDEDEDVKNNHLKLLNRFIDVFSNVADFEKLGGGKS